jgi:hypothetical protein
MYFDSPYGYNLFPHDEQITVQALLTQSKQFDAINTQGNHVWIVLHKPDDTHIVKTAMDERNYKNLQHLYWTKPNHYVDGPVNRLTPCVEMITVGFFPNANEIHWNVSNDPRQRPNMLSCPSVLSLAKDTAGNTINVTEKPLELAEWLLGIWCKKGATVLIVGTGAGGCLKGALRAGMNVIGVENDEKQYNQLFSEMNAWVANVKKEKQQPKSKAPKPAKGDEPKSPVKGDQQADYVMVESVATVSAVQEGKCFSCEEPGTEENPLAPCAQCEKMNHSVDCMENYNGKDGAPDGLVCSGCNANLFGDA